ncbi:unnamed protein product [Protopolystoma xenopodis]|uniref:Uncharacterized protein n=1 Tax=Protopolystoma xenopodis TaxID=117903 RepID=A0A3S5AJE0_9PLAT|nr:unnamed protein product [Protopolystoma xenopodis]
MYHVVNMCMTQMTLSIFDAVCPLNNQTRHDFAHPYMFSLYTHTHAHTHKHAHTYAWILAHTKTYNSAAIPAKLERTRPGQTGPTYAFRERYSFKPSRLLRPSWNSSASLSFNRAAEQLISPRWIQQRLLHGSQAVRVAGRTGWLSSGQESDFRFLFPPPQREGHVRRGRKADLQNGESCFDFCLHLLLILLLAFLCPHTF